MVEPISLNRERKARASVTAKAQAAENRVRFGRTKAERDAADGERALGDRRLDAHRREPKPG